jgi:hypothetical protein
MELSAMTTGAGVSGSFYDTNFGTALQLGVTQATGQWAQTVSSTTVSLVLTGGSSDSTFVVQATCLPISPNEVIKVVAEQDKFGVIIISDYNATLGDFQYSNNETKIWSITCANATGNVVVPGLNGTASDTDTLILRNVDTGVEESYTGERINVTTTLSASSEVLVYWTSNAAGTDRGYAVAYTCISRSGAAQVSLTVAAGMLTMLLALLL